MENQSYTYKLLIVGANGGIGRQCIEQALNAGFLVTALVRNPANLRLIHRDLEVVQGDLLQPGTIEKYLAGKDAVVSAIGVKGGMFGDKPTNLYSEGNANLLQAMEDAGVKRGFFISASAIEISPVIPRFVQFLAKYVIQKLLKHMYADLHRMEIIVKASDAKWTIIRPPQLSDQPATGHYRIAINDWLKDCLKISRADVAHFIIHNINNPAIIKTTVEIAY
jgi:putative NADH-flavin reductase